MRRSHCSSRALGCGFEPSGIDGAVQHDRLCPDLLRGRRGEVFLGAQERECARPRNQAAPAEWARSSGGGYSRAHPRCDRAWKLLLHAGARGRGRAVAPCVERERACAVVVAAARRLAAEEGVAMPTADGLLAIPGVLQDGSAALDDDAAERRDAAVLAEFGKAIGALKRARRRGGGAARGPAQQSDRSHRADGRRRREPYRPARPRR